MKIFSKSISYLPQISYKKQQIINCSQKILYSVISQTQNYQNFIPFINKSSIIKTISPYQNYTQLTISYNKFKQLSYTSHVVMKPPSQSQSQQQQIGNICSVQSICRDQPLKMLQSLWVIQKISQDKSYVKYRLEFQFHSKLYMLASSILKDYLGYQLWNIFQKQSIIEQNIYNNNNKFNYQSNFPQNNSVKQQIKQILSKPGIIQHNTQIQSPLSNLTNFMTQKQTQIIDKNMQNYQLNKFLLIYPQIKHLYQTNKQLKNKINLLHKRLQNLQQYQHKMKYQINNLLTHL